MTTDEQIAAQIGADGCRRYYGYYRAALRDRKRKYGRTEYFRRAWTAGAWFFRREGRR